MVTFPNQTRRSQLKSPGSQSSVSRLHVHAVAQPRSPSFNLAAGKLDIVPVGELGGHDRTLLPRLPRRRRRLQGVPRESSLVG